MDFAFLTDWHQFLPREAGHVIAFAGGGGKTSLMLACGEQYRAEAVPVILTTTTRSEPVPAWPVVQWRELAAAAARQGGASDPDGGPETAAPAGRLPRWCYLSDGTHADGKWRGLEPEQVDRLASLAPDHVVLVEADGAAGRPVKLHRSDEPRWPGRTSLAVLVVGTGALAEPVGQVVHRWGELPPGPLVSVAADTSWGWQQFHALLMESGGYLDRVPRSVPIALALTQLGDLDDGIGLFDFVARVMAEPRLPLVLFCELDPERRNLRTAYRAAENIGPGDAG